MVKPRVECDVLGAKAVNLGDCESNGAESLAGLFQVNSTTPYEKWQDTGFIRTQSKGNIIKANPLAHHDNSLRGIESK
jgi:hypothetical protein